MSEEYPTPQEVQEWLDELWGMDRALWEYLMFYEEPDEEYGPTYYEDEEDEEEEEDHPYTDFGDYDERAYFMGEYDDE